MAASGSDEASDAGQPGTDLMNQCQTPNMPLASPQQPPTGGDQRVARTPPPSRPWRVTLTQACQGRRHHRANLAPARSQKPRKPHLTRSSAQPTGKGRPAGTTTTSTTPLSSPPASQGEHHVLGAGASGLRALGRQRPPPQRPRGTGGGPRFRPMARQAHDRGAARPGRQHPMAAYFAVPPARGGNPHQGRHHLRPSDGAHAPRHHGSPRPVALCGHPAHGAYRGLQPGRNERATLAVAPTRSPAHLYSHANAQHLGHPWISQLPGVRLKPPATTVSRGPRAPQGRRHAVTPNDATRGHHPGLVPPLARTEAPSDPRRDQGSPHTQCMQSGTPERHQETTRPGRPRRRSRTPPPAARQVVLQEDMDRGHGGPNDLNAQQKSSATDPRRRSRRPRTERAHIPTIPTPAERERQAALQTDPHQSRRPNVQLVCRLPPRVGGRPDAWGTACRGHTAKVTRGPPKACTRGGGTTPQRAPTQAGRGDTGPGHGHPPSNQLGPYTTGFPMPAATQPNRRGAEDAP